MDVTVVSFSNPLLLLMPCSISAFICREEARRPLRFANGVIQSSIIFFLSVLSLSLLLSNTPFCFVLNLMRHVHKIEEHFYLPLRVYCSKGKLINIAITKGHHKISQKHFTTNFLSFLLPLSLRFRNLNIVPSFDTKRISKRHVYILNFLFASQQTFQILPECKNYYIIAIDSAVALMQSYIYDKS